MVVFTTKGAATFESSIHGRRRYNDKRTVGCYGKLEIKFITGKLNSKMGIEMIDEQINTYVTRIAGNRRIF